MGLHTVLSEKRLGLRECLFASESKNQRCSGHKAKSELRPAGSQSSCWCSLSLVYKTKLIPVSGIRPQLPRYSCTVHPLADITMALPGTFDCILGKKDYVQVSSVAQENRASESSRAPS